jgi:peptidoglycan hydrolase-like protein with peptidoglycan-binding domain
MTTRHVGHEGRRSKSAGRLGIAATGAGGIAMINKRVSFCAVLLLLAGCTQFPQVPTQIAGYVPTSDYLTRQTQIQLIRLGYLHDVADGVLGPRTQNAINEFEQANNMTVDGHPSMHLIVALQVSNAVATIAPTVVPTAPVESPAQQQAWVQPTEQPNASQPHQNWVTPNPYPNPSAIPAAATASGWVSPK